jgi:rhodanese-related sulfurtransferase
VVVVDARLAADYARGHIPGAINLPLSGLGWVARAEAIDRLPADRPVVVHCQSDQCQWGDILAAELLARRGGRVAVLRPGYAGWNQRHGNPPAGL